MQKNSEETKPNGTFFQIQINAENLDSEETRMSGGQFYLLDDILVTKNT